jgi:DNA-binding CsgD family transcriptional regulator
VLFGRSAETGAIDRLLAGARGGQSGVLVIRGEAGIGKSALLEHAAGAAEGMTVLRGIGIESEAELAFAALHQVLRPALGRIDALPGPQAAALRAAFALSSETVDDRFRVAVAVLGLLAELAEEQPVLCLIDDAQWLDHASAEALLFAARRLQVEALAMLFAARDDPGHPFPAPGLPELRPAALGASDARALAADTMGAGAAGDAVDWVLENANGNPLALLELPATLSAGQLAGRESLSDVVPSMTSVEEGYVDRLSRLSAGTRGVLLLCAAEETGDRATISAAAVSHGLDAGELAAAEQEGLVRVTTSHVEFRHPLVRSAVYRGAGFAEREGAHRALAAVLTDDRDADRRAWHLAASTTGPDEAVAETLEETADRARLRGGYGAAAAALERASDLTADPEERGRRLVRAAYAAELAGRSSHAMAIADRAAPLLRDPLLQADLEQTRGHAEFMVGRADAAADILSAASIAVRPHDEVRAIELAGSALEAAGASGDLSRVARAIEAGRDIAPREERELALRAQFDGFAHVFQGDLAAATPYLQEVVRRAETLDDPRTIVHGATAALFTGDDERARELWTKAIALARAEGAPSSLAVILSHASWQSLLAQRFSEAAALADEAVRLSSDLGIENPALRPRGVKAWIAAFQGREEECFREAHEVLQVSAARGLALPAVMAAWALAELNFGRGRWEEALAGYEQVGELRPGFGSPITVIWSLPDRAEAAVRAGREDAARSVAAQFEQWAETTGVPWGPPLVARLHALLADTPEQAIAHYEDALRLHSSAATSYSRARTQLLYGELLRRERQRTAAREQLRPALATFEEERAALWAERAGAELRATGETARRRDPSTIAQLTPQEEQIARLVAEGGSNKEIAAQLFLSPRTVEYHLRKVFSKLGITSRAELIRQAAKAADDPAAFAVT